VNKNKKGFTLIELLAVIVILGLLMAIAIPSITRYITQSRKKTAVSTAQNYMSALINEVNALEYTFTGTDTVYAVPIECISVERGGKSPFGEWLQANNAYWAYVLVQYDELNSSYTYGFTFKDSAGYGMYPTSEDKIYADGSQIQTGLNLTRPVSGDIEKIAAEDKWTGFDVDSSTNLIVLESASEGDIGDGEKTCTLCQKGPNYQIAEEEKEDLYKSEEEIKAAQKEEDLKKTAYAIYSADDDSLTFVRFDIDEYNEVKASEKYNGKSASIIYDGSDSTKGFEVVEYSSNSNVPWYRYRSDIKSVTFKDRIYPKSTALWFYQFEKCHTFDVGKLKTDEVTNMRYMFFFGGGYSEKDVKIIGLEDWVTSKVTDMSYMFPSVGMYAPSTYIGDLSKWNVSSVQYMSGMFYQTAFDSTSINLTGLENWDTSIVTKMDFMFQSAGRNINWSLNLSRWKVQNVTTYNNFNNGVTDKVISPTWVN